MVVGRKFDQADAGQRAEQTRRGQGKREEHEVASRGGEIFPLRDGQRGGDGHRGDHGVAIGFEKIRAHTGDIAHVVAHVVGDDTRVTRIVLRDTRFDFAHEVGTDVGCLGENASADTVENGDERRAHGEAVDDVDVFLRLAEKEEERPHPEQPHGGHGESHDGTTEERGGQRRARAFVVRSQRGAHVDVRGGIHPDVAGQRGSCRAEEERERLPRILEAQETSDHDGEGADEEEFAAHEDHGAGVDLSGDFGDASITARFDDDAAVSDEGDGQAGQAEQGDEEVEVFHGVKNRRKARSG